MSTRHTSLSILSALVALLPANAQPFVYKPRDGFCIHSKGITLPLSQFLLVRKGNQVGALRLIQVIPDTNSRPRGSEWLGSVSYESYYTSGSHQNSPWLLTDKHIGDLVFGRYKGFGFHYSWQSGNQYAKVGPWKFLFFYPDGMYMTAVSFSHGVNDDSGVEFAPTGETDINKINLNNADLRWFKVDDNANMPCPLVLTATPSPKEDRRPT